MYGPKLDCGPDSLGRRIMLVPPTKDHCPHCVAWLADPNVTRYLNDGYAFTIKQEEEWIEQVGTDQTQIEWGIEVDGAHVGMAGIHQIKPVTHHAVSGLMIGDPEYWGLGIASAVMARRARYAFREKNLGALLTAICTENTGSLKAAMKAGYEQWGLCPGDRYVDGKFLDTWHGILTRERWESLNAS